MTDDNTFYLSFPIKPHSVNACYRAIHGRSILSKSARAWKATFKELMITQWAGRPPLVGNIHISLEFIFTDNRRRDIDNFIKITQDGMNGIVFLDDSQIIKLTAIKTNGAKHNGIEIKIYTV